MLADWVARGIATTGAATGSDAIAWNVSPWRRSGPVLKGAAVVSGRVKEAL
jgi:hypothetical protein